MTTERKFKEQEFARYRLLERQVTDPLAQSLLNIIIIELEAGLQADRKTFAPALANVYRSPPE